MDNWLERALSAKRESKHIEFKESFNASSAGAWCEIIKDLVALANSGGGVILIGVDNSGNPKGTRIEELSRMDSALITDKIAKYTSCQFDGFEIQSCEKNKVPLAAIQVNAVEYPIVFEKPGTYASENGKQKNAFKEGTIYVRHGAKSEPLDNADIVKIFTRMIKKERAEWKKGLRKVINAPRGAKVEILGHEIIHSDSETGYPIYLTDDPNAPSYKLTNPDQSYPFRQKEVVSEVSKQIPEGQIFNQYDVQAIRSVYNVDANNQFCYKPKFGTRQYSKTFVNWIATQYKDNVNFFNDARAASSQRRVERRKKPS